jgi:hypothetical protein
MCLRVGYKEKYEKIKKKYFFLHPLKSLKKGVVSLFRGKDPRICTNMSRIPYTGKNSKNLFRFVCRTNFFVLLETLPEHVLWPPPHRCSPPPLPLHIPRAALLLPLLLLLLHPDNSG